jgi:hypothetical protein
MVYTFKVGKNTYKFSGKTAGEAMTKCNRQIMDKLNVGPFSWYDSVTPNSFYCGLGNNFD